MDVKACSIYFRKDVFLVISSISLPNGLNRIAPPMLRVLGTKPSTLGRTILSALENSRESANLSVEEKKKQEMELFKLAGVRSWSALESLWEYIDVEQVGHRIELRRGSRAQNGGFEFLPKSAPIYLPTAESLGNEVLRISWTDPSGMP